jgi:methionyl-tRNA formyltransferase
MKVIFFGTPPFAAHILEAIIADGIEVVGVVSRPDKSKGRSGTPVPTDVKLYLQSHDRLSSIPIFQPEKCSTSEFATILRKLNADVFVVVAYGEIIKKAILDIPPLGCINIHASLLPRLRGAAPIQRSIMNGDTETGITIMHMVRKMDAGDMISVCTVEIEPDMTFGELELAMMDAAAPLLLKTLKEITAHTAQRVVQDESLVTFAPKIELEDCEINWNKSALEIHNLIRGVNPYPGAWTWMPSGGDKKRVKIFRSKITVEVFENGKPGTIIGDKKGFKVICGDGKGLEILELQIEGKKGMSAGDFIRGYLNKNVENLSFGL